MREKAAICAASGGWCVYSTKAAAILSRNRLCCSSAEGFPAVNGVLMAPFRNLWPNLITLTNLCKKPDIFVNVRGNLCLTMKIKMNQAVQSKNKRRLIIATHNPGKVKEFAKLIDLPGLVCISAGELGLPEPKETGESFAENAALKARAAAKASGEAALADDSGLCVAALDDAPGIYSARWAGENKDFGAAMQRLEMLLQTKKDHPMGRKAKFVAVLALFFPDGKLVYGEGSVEGVLVNPTRGSNGFGYDPCFQPLGSDLTFGEMSAEQKTAFSHRAHALADLRGKAADFFEQAS